MPTKKARISSELYKKGKKDDASKRVAKHEKTESKEERKMEGYR